MNIVFFGTPQFSVIVLQKLIDAGIIPVAVVSAPDRPAGRGHKLVSPPVKQVAEEYHVAILQPEKLKDEQFLEHLRDVKPDVFVIASYGKILPRVLLDIPLHGTINVHPSLLPKYRGPSPIQTALLNGDKETGVTLMLTDFQMDHGPILSQKELEFSIFNFQFSQLHDELANLAGKMLLETVPQWVAGEITPKEQEHEKATFTKLFTKEDGHIDWSKSAIEIDRMVRALNPWPGTWSFIKIPKVKLPELKRIKILEGYPAEGQSSNPLGTLFKTKSGHLAAATRDGIYVIEKLQMEGKKSIPGSVFVFNEQLCLL